MCVAEAAVEICYGMSYGVFAADGLGEAHEAHIGFEHLFPKEFSTKITNLGQSQKHSRQKGQPIRNSDLPDGTDNSQCTITRLSVMLQAQSRKVPTWPGIRPDETYPRQLLTAVGDHARLSIVAAGATVGIPRLRSE